MKKFISIISWRRWGVIRYNSFWQNIAGLFYLGLLDQRKDLAFIGQAGLFLLLTTLMTAYGYLINDFADVELDRKHGKPNAFQNVKRGKAAIIVLILLALQPLAGLPFLTSPWFVAVWLTQALAASFYSLPPLRMKERGLAGLLTTVTAQQTLPTALLFAAFGHMQSWGMLVFVAFSTIRGLSSDVGHQLRDWVYDSQTQTGTFAVQKGYRQVQFLYAASLELERLSLGMVMVKLLLDLPAWVVPVVNLPIAIAWPAAIIYLALIVLTAGHSWLALRRGQLAEEDPYNEGRQARSHDALYIIHHPLPSVLLPLYLACWLALGYWPHTIFVVVLGIRYGLFSKQRWGAVLSLLRR